MIDSTIEELITLTQAAAELPQRRRGRKTHVSTLYRWATSGCRGVRLEVLQCGGTACTSREALQRFFEAVTLARTSNPSTTAPSLSTGVLRRSTAKRLRDSQRAGELLDRMGV